MLKNAKFWSITPESSSGQDELRLEKIAMLNVPTDLTQGQILNNFADPKAISFWSLPNFISKLELSGFSAARHKIYYQSEIARPLFLLSMMLIGAGFALSHNRFGQTGILILTSVLSGFLLFSIKRVAISLGEAQEIPLILAAYGPSIAGIFLTMGLLLHLEDG